MTQASLHRLAVGFRWGHLRRRRLGAELCCHWCSHCEGRSQRKQAERPPGEVPLSLLLAWPGPSSLGRCHPFDWAPEDTQENEVTLGYVPAGFTLFDDMDWPQALKSTELAGQSMSRDTVIPCQSYQDWNTTSVTTTLTTTHQKH